MKFSQFSIRTTLLTIISVLNVLIAVLTGSGVYRSWSSLDEIHELKRQSATINLLYTAEKHLSIERALSMAIVNMPPEMSQPMRETLASDRANVDETIAAALIHITPRGNRELSAALEKVQSSRENMQNLRLRLDRLLARPGDTEDARFDDLIFDTITTAVTDIEALIKILSDPLLYINTSVSHQIFFKHFTWEIMEYAGREYATIGNLIVENKIPEPLVKDRLMAWKARTEHDWELSRQFAKTSGLSEKMRSHIEEAETHYFVTFDQIKDMFYQTGGEQIQPPYPIGIELWLEMSSQALESLMALKDMALQETQGYIEHIERLARRSIYLNLLMFVSALALSFYSWWVILQRVIKPVDRMADSLYRQAYTEIPKRSLIVPQDEIAKLSLALEVFQENKRRIERASLDLQQQRDNLKAIFETALDAIVTIDEEDQIIEWNSQAEAIFGWSRDEVLGRKMVDIFVPAQHREAHKEGMIRFLTDGTSRILNKRIELEALNKKGETFPIELAVTAIRVDNKFNFTAFISDITERKKSEEERQIYMRNLENSNRELDDFAYIASHDLKEPLRGLHNFSRFLVEDYEDQLDDEGRNMLHTIAGLTKRMDSLLSSLLHYSRLGRTELSVRKTDLNEIVRNAIAMYEVRIKESHADVKIVRPLPEIVCDHVRISEVFQNLIGNALKYSEAVEKTIEIGYLDDHPDRPGEHVYFVRDNGIGIDQRNLESIFKIFRRLHAQDLYGGGTGSGLTIAKKIINQHGGQIWAESKGKNQGTTFYFTMPPQKLPVAEQAA